MLFLAGYFDNMEAAAGIQVVGLVVIAIAIGFIYSQLKGIITLLFKLEQHNQFAAMQRKEIIDALKKLNVKE